ncbi:hypothetical protein QMK19_03540 [Streptomyces sp. H10-C2]|uniref:hypothetical protein n=1 Tax=unclassified Streptomyces TaxID=2593676 RepID=UPI0024BB313F|nr:MULTISPECIES: hypothetical protein [unclassified Streptomyces]MDJ0342260.1 hypothetical protein [Streptomyces sp. PH10-H1]MDJ0368774.1 hypothetical protein [Streptomyces sp. H10-C2]
MPAIDPYATLRAPLTGQPPLEAAAFPSGHPDAPPQREPAPPGMAWTLLPNGETRLGYLPPGYEKVTDEPVTVSAGRDKWPGRLLSGGASTALVLGVIGHYGPALNQAGHGAEMAGIGVAATAAGIGLVVSLVKGATGSARQGRVDVTLNLTNTVTSTSKSHHRSR